MANNYDKLLQIISFAKGINFEVESTINNKAEIARMIYEFVVTVDSQYSELLNDLTNSVVRFSDYYDYDLPTAEDIINKFYIDYNYKDVDRVCELFVLYILLNNANRNTNPTACHTAPAMVDTIKSFLYSKSPRVFCRLSRM